MNFCLLNSNEFCFTSNRTDFKCCRSSNGDVRVNWATVTKSNTTMKAGDLISVSGKGRLKVSNLLHAMLLHHFFSSSSFSFFFLKEKRSCLFLLLKDLSFLDLKRHSFSSGWRNKLYKEGEICSGTHSLSVITAISPLHHQEIWILLN